MLRKNFRTDFIRKDSELQVENSPPFGQINDVSCVTVSHVQGFVSQLM
jgi:hypothetical protein